VPSPPLIIQPKKKQGRERTAVEGYTMKRRGIKRHRPTREMSPAVIDALNHPLRRQLLRDLHEGSNRSATGLADSIKPALGNIIYHLKVLRDRGLIRQTGSKRNRGAREYFYASVVADNVQVVSILAATAKDDKAMRKRQ
jgi:DNA-binding transcriptional ArsR family regulator